MWARLSLKQSKPNAAADGTKAVKAKMGKPNNMYFSEEFNRWIVPGTEEAVRQEQALLDAPPPPASTGSIPPPPPNFTTDLTSRYPVPDYAGNYFRPTSAHRRTQSTLTSTAVVPQATPDEAPLDDVNSSTSPKISSVLPPPNFKVPSASLPPTPLGLRPPIIPAAHSHPPPLSAGDADSQHATRDAPDRADHATARPPPPLGRPPLNRPAAALKRTTPPTTSDPFLPPRPEDLRAGDLRAEAPRSEAPLPPPLPSQENLSSLDQRPPLPPSSPKSTDPNFKQTTRNFINRQDHSRSLPFPPAPPPPSLADSNAQRPDRRDSAAMSHSHHQQQPHQQLLSLQQDRPVPLAQDRPVPLAQDRPVPLAQDRPVPLSQDRPVPLSQDRPVSLSQDRRVSLSQDQQQRAPVQRQMVASLMAEQQTEVEGSRPLAMEPGRHERRYSQQSKRASSLVRSHHNYAASDIRSPSMSPDARGRTGENAVAHWFVYRRRMEAARSISVGGTVTPDLHSRRHTGLDLPTPMQPPDPLPVKKIAKLEQMALITNMVARASLKDAYFYSEPIRSELLSQIKTLRKFGDHFPKLSTTLQSLSEILASSDDSSHTNLTQSEIKEKILTSQIDLTTQIATFKQRLLAVQDAWRIEPLPPTLVPIILAAFKMLKKLSDKVSCAHRDVDSLRDDFGGLVGELNRSRGALEDENRRLRKELIEERTSLVDAKSAEKLEVVSERSRWLSEKNELLVENGKLREKIENQEKEFRLRMTRRLRLEQDEMARRMKKDEEMALKAKEAEEEISRLRTEVSGLKRIELFGRREKDLAREKELTRELEETRRRVKDLEGDLGDEALKFKTEVNWRDQLISDLTSNLQEERQEVMRMEQLLEETKVNLEDTKRRLCQVQQQVNQNQLQDSDGHQERLRAEKEQLRAEQEHLRAEKEQLRAEKEQLRAEKEQLEGRVRDLEAERRQEREMRQLDMERLQRRSDVKCEELSAKYQKALEDYERVKSACEEQVSKYQRLESEHQSVTTRLHTLVADHEELTCNHNNLTAELEAKWKEQLESEKKVLEEKRSDVEEQLSALERQLAASEEDNRKLNEERRKLDEEVGNVRENCLSLKERNKILEATCAQAREDHDKLQEEYQSLVKEIAQLKNDLEDYKGMAEFTDRLIANMREALADKTKRLESLQEKILQMHHQMQTIQISADQIRNRILTVKDAADRLEKHQPILIH